MIGKTDTDIMTRVCVHMFENSAQDEPQKRYYSQVDTHPACYSKLDQAQQHMAVYVKKKKEEEEDVVVVVVEERISMIYIYMYTYLRFRVSHAAWRTLTRKPHQLIYISIPTLSLSL